MSLFFENVDRKGGFEGHQTLRPVAGRTQNRASLHYIQFFFLLRLTTVRTAAELISIKPIAIRVI